MTGITRGAIALSLLLSLSGSESQVESVYSDLEGRRCKQVSFDSRTGELVRQCRGAAGYRLLVEDADLRVTVTVIAPDRRRHPLHYPRVVTPGLTTLGTRAEWRVERRGRRWVPIALIVPVNAYEPMDFPHRIRPYLAVTKITADSICVTEKIPPGPEALEQARQAADRAATQACLPPQPGG